MSSTGVIRINQTEVPAADLVSRLQDIFRVIGGFDFVGEAWPGGPLAPDPDPIDCGPSAIADPCDGGNDGASHKGVAPDASLYAEKFVARFRRAVADWLCCRASRSPSTRVPDAPYRSFREENKDLPHVDGK